MAAVGYPTRTQDLFEIFGDRATARLAGTRVSLLGPDPRDRRFAFARGYQRSFDGAIGHFVDSLIHNVPFETGLSDNLETLRLVERAYEAAGVGPSGQRSGA